MSSIPEVAPVDREAVTWEAIACPVCGGADEDLVITVPSGPEQPDYRLVRCRQCGMGYVNPRPDPASIGCFYPQEYEWYQVSRRRRPGKPGRWGARLRRLVMSHYLGHPPVLTHWYEKALAVLAGPWFRPGRGSLTSLRFQGEGRLLDYGCGAGWFAHRMRVQGWTVTGMDFSDHAARQVERHYQLPVLVGTLPHPAIKPGSFDVITMGSVLEHVHWPHQVIAAAAQALRPGGLLVLVVPNLASWGFRFFREDWWPLTLPIHLLHFSPPTLRRLVEAHGLEVDELRMVARPGWMRRSLALARDRRQLSLPRALLARLGQFRIIPSLLTRWTVWSGQADCLLLSARRPRQAGRSEVMATRLVSGAGSAPRPQPAAVD